MKKISNILIAGVGGQGILLTSDVLSQAAMISGRDVKKSEIHGMSQRGGSVFSFVRFGEKVFSPVIPLGETDVLISFEQMEVLRWMEYTNRETRIIYSDVKIPPAQVILGKEKYPEEPERILKNAVKGIIKLEKEKIISKIKSLKFLNMALLGAASAFLDIPENAWEAAVEQIVPQTTVKENINAFFSGQKYARQED